jgi:hypothetical protein
MLVQPSLAWRRIAQEPADPAHLLSSYVALLALIPAICGFIGACAIGVTLPGGVFYRAPLIEGFLGVIFGYVAAFVEVLLVGGLIYLLAPLFKAHRGFPEALKLSTYAFTPVWLAGIFLLLPGLRFLLLIGLYGAYVLYRGMPLLAKVAPAKSLPYAACATAFAAALMLAVAGTQRALFAWVGI